MKGRPGPGGRKKGLKSNGGESSAASGTEYDPLTIPRLPANLNIASSTDVPKRKGKAMRKWGDGHPSADDMGELDFSEKPSKDAGNSAVGADFLQSLVDEHSRGTMSKDGLYEIKDLDFKAGSANEAADDAVDTAFSRATSGGVATPAAAAFGGIGGLFARLTGSKVLTREDLAPVLAAMKDHLMKKNVAVDIADKICEGVGDSLVGKKTGGFGGESTFRTIRVAISPIWIQSQG